VYTLDGKNFLTSISRMLLPLLARSFLLRLLLLLLAI